MLVAINYAGTGAVSECENEQVAIEQLKREYPGCVFGDWDADGWNADDQPMQRMLCWASEEDSENDDGAKSVAQITRVRPVTE